MPARNHAFTAAMALAAGACATNVNTPDRRIGTAILSLASGQSAGTAQIAIIGGTATVSAALTGLAPGSHGIHLHAVGSCNIPDFTSAGGHLNPRGRQHGAMAPGGSHVGDLPNIEVKPNGSGSLAADLPGTADEVRGWLFDADGTAIVVHAEPDDYRTDPSGNSGARIACGVFKPV